MSLNLEKRQLGETKTRQIRERPIRHPSHAQTFTMIAEIPGLSNHTCGLAQRIQWNASEELNLKPFWVQPTARTPGGSAVKESAAPNKRAYWKAGGDGFGAEGIYVDAPPSPNPLTAAQHRGVPHEPALSPAARGILLNNDAPFLVLNALLGGGAQNYQLPLYL